jgi:hypothetical protein
MKTYYLFPVFLLLFLIGMPAEVTAQRNAGRTVAVVKVDRATKRKVKRTKRRVRRRTLKSLPAGTRAVVYRKVSYYPVSGRFYVARKGVYVRSFPPRGFRIRTLGVRPVRIVLRSRTYWYAEGVFYQKQGEDYIVSETPIGAVVPELPEDAAEIDWAGVSAYELNNAIYQEVDSGYELIDILEEEN